MKKFWLLPLVAAFVAAGCSSVQKCVTASKYVPFPAPAKFAYRTDAPALRFPAIIVIYGDDDRDLTKTTSLIKHLYHTAGITEFAVSLPLNPQGKDPYIKPGVYAERFARLKKLITNPEIKLGVLLQATIGHGARWNSNPNRTVNWQRTVNSQKELSIRFCTLDPDFRAYIKRSVSGIFVSKPEFVLFDDDIRHVLRSTFECFCPLHTAYFNKKYGTNYTPEELRQAVLNAPAGGKLLKNFSEARLETLEQFITIIRRELDKHNPAARGIYCTVGHNIVDMGRIAKACAGKNISAMRIGNGLYLEKEVRHIVNRFFTASIQITAYRDQINELLDESDTCPHSLFSKTAHTMNLHIIMGVLHGLDGGKLWIANNRFYAPEPIVRFPQTIGKYQGLYRELHRTLKGVKWHGGLQSVPAPERDSHPEFAGEFGSIRSWQGFLTGFFGLPNCYGKADVRGVHMLSGNQVNSFSDAELKRFLSEGAILDAAAAANLEKRNLAHLTGVKPRLITRRTATEWMDGLNYPIRKFGAKQFEFIPADRKNPPRALSHFRVTEYNHAAQSRKVCNGAVIFKNKLGGKVVTVPFEICDSRISIVPERQAYMRKIFDLMGILPAWSPEPFDVFFRFGTLANGKQDIAAVCNISYQPMEKVLIGVKKIPAKIEKLSPDGGWDKCDFTVRGNILELNDKLACAEAGIYKFYYTDIP